MNKALPWAPSWIAAWNVVALVMFVRSLASEPTPRPSWQIVFVAILLGAVVMLARWYMFLRRSGQPQDLAPRERWLPMMFTPGAIIFTLWLSNLHPELLAAVFIWLTLLASEVLTLVRCCIGLNMMPEAFATRELPNRDDQTSPPGKNMLDLSPLGDDIVQRVERVNDHGTQVVRGLVRIDYPSEQRIGSVSVGFVPPLLNHPTAEAEVVWGCDATVAVKDIHPQGVEFEARRELTEDDQTYTIVEFFACSQASQA